MHQFLPWVLTQKMFFQRFVVLCVFCLFGYSSCITNNTPNRRLYFYNPDIFPHAAAAINMLLPQPHYKPIPSLEIPNYHQLEYPQYGGLHEEEEDEEEHEEYEHKKQPPNLQLFALVKPKKTKNKGTKNKKQKGQKGGGGPGNKIKKYFKKCLPFKLRIIKKSDVYNHPFYPSRYDNLHYTHRSKYPKEEDMALISFNTSGIFETEDKSNFPQVLNFLYPTYHNYHHAKSPPSPRRKPIRKFPKRQIILKSRKPWRVKNHWRTTPPGKPIVEYPLKETFPGEIGGSPPPSPLYNVYKDNRIPVNQDFIQEQAQNQFKSPIQNNVLINQTRYSDPDYYRYGIYDQNQFYYPPEENNKTLVADSSNVKYYYHSTFSVSPEKVVTVTPSTSWVPIPQVQQKTSNNRVNFKSGGFKSFSFGDRIPRNCTYQNVSKTIRCLEKVENIPKPKYVQKQQTTMNNYPTSQPFTETNSGKHNEVVKSSNRRHKQIDQEIRTYADIVTAPYPEDNLDNIYNSVTNLNAVKARRSGKELTAVVSGSLLVKES